MIWFCIIFFFFKQKTAYEMRISDWSSDVCSSDLVNYHQIPVNAARCPVHSNHRDGQGRADGNYGGLPHYEPNSFNQWQEQPQYREPPLKISGDADWWNYRDNDDNYFKQPGDLRSEEHTSELQSLMRISYAVFCLKKKTNNINIIITITLY